MSDVPQSSALSQRNAEYALLGMLLYDQTLFEGMEHFQSEYFSLAVVKEVYDEMHRQYLDRRALNATTLHVALANRPQMAARIDEILDGMEVAIRDHKEDLAARQEQARNNDEEFKPAQYSAELLKSYATGIRDTHCLWRLQKEGKQYLSSLENATHLSVEERLDAALGGIEGLTVAIRYNLAEGRGSRRMTDILRTTFDHMQDIHDRKSRLLGLPTGFYELDDILGGLQAGNFYVVGGRPSMGKTSFIANILENLALREQKPAAFFSLEMGEQVLMRQMLCSHARVDSTLLSSGRISEEEFQKLVLAAGGFHESPLFINDFHGYPKVTLDTLIAEANKLKRRENIQLLGIDYLQLINAPGRESREQEVGTISGALKHLAKSLNIPVVVLSQLNRGAEAREDNKPRLSDLRESGAIEQDADAVMLLYRDEFYRPDTELRGIAEVNVAKNRTGPTGRVDLAFLKQFTRFENLAMAPGRDGRSW